MLGIVSHEGNANQTHSETPPHSPEMARLGKSDEKQLWVRTQRNQELRYCWVGGGEGAGEWHSHFGKQVCRFLIVQTQSYQEARNPEILPLGGYAKEFKQVC